MELERFEVMLGITLLFGITTFWLERSGKKWKNAPFVGRTNNLVYGIANVLFFFYAMKIFIEVGM